MKTGTVRTLIVFLVISLTITAVVVVISAGRDIPTIDQYRILKPYTIEPPQSDEMDFLPPQIQKKTFTEDEQQEVANKEPIPEYPYKLHEWQAKLYEAFEARITVRFVDRPFEDAIRDVAQKLGVRIIIDPSIRTEDLTVSLRLREVRGKNTLLLVLSAGPDLSYELTSNGILVKLDEDVSRSETEKILSRIESARWSVAEEKPGQKLVEKLRATQPHGFRWYDKTTGQALKEIGDVYGLTLRYYSGELAHYQEAPQVSWEGNAPEALKYVLENAGLAYRCYKDHVGIYAAKEFTETFGEEEERSKASERFLMKRFWGKTENVPLHKLIDRLQRQTGVRTYPDMATWEAGVRVTLPGENPTVKQLLDYLQKKHCIKHWFELDSETGAQSLFLLKSQ